MAMPSIPGLPGLPTLGMIFPPTWIVIDNGDPGDVEVSNKVVNYLMTKIPPVFATRKQVNPGEEPDSIDLMAHGIVIVGGPVANKFLQKYLASMDPTWVNKGTEAAPNWYLVRKTDTAYETNNTMACLITSCQGSFPWLTVYNIAGMSREATAKAGDLFCAGNLKGIWIDSTPV